MIAGVPWWMFVALAWGVILVSTLVFIAAAALLEAHEYDVSEREFAVQAEIIEWEFPQMEARR